MLNNIEQIRQQLIAQRAELSKRIKAINKDIHHQSTPVEKDFAEQVTQRENDDVLSALDDEARQTIQLIDAALERIKSNKYGLCQFCGEPIAKERLTALPFATTCIRCAEKLASAD